MKGDSLSAVRKAIEELRTVEQSLMMEGSAAGGRNIPTNEVLQKHRNDTKSWKVTSNIPSVVASFAFEEAGTTPTYPHIQTMTQDKDEPLVDFFDKVREYMATHVKNGEALTYLDIRLCSTGLTLDVVDKPTDEQSAAKPGDETQDDTE
jgi:hypothetical protein